MSRVLLAAIASVAIISTIAEAADGCGRGMYYNGRRCVPQPGYYEPPPRYYEPRARYCEFAPRYYESAGPQLQIDLGGGGVSAYARKKNPARAGLSILSGAVRPNWGDKEKGPSGWAGWMMHHDGADRRAHNDPGVVRECVSFDDSRVDRSGTAAAAQARVY